MMKKILFVTTLLLLASYPLAAENVYLDDKIKIWSRTGPSNDYKVKYKVTPGTRFEVLQKNPDTGFVQIKDSAGRTSWLDGKFLTNQPTAGHLLVDAQAKISAMQQNHQNTQSSLEKKLKTLQPLTATNQKLQNKMAQMQTDLEQVRQEKQVYQGRFVREVFFSGAVVFVAGMLLGWLLSKLGGNKRGKGWS